jgi:hypothetical protein
MIAIEDACLTVLCLSPYSWDCFANRISPQNRNWGLGFSALDLSQSDGRVDSGDPAPRN